MGLNDELLSRKEVRLFPSHKNKSEGEAELRATAAFLAAARAVSEFGHAVVSMAGGPKGKIRCYTEVTFKNQNDSMLSKDRPDGIIRSTFGKKDWTALVEVKVGNQSLGQDQFERYHALAKERGMDAFITISNQPALTNGLPPGVKPRFKVPRVTHLSWERLLSEAQRRQKEVADPDQQWILQEWIRYVADKNSHIIELPQMGKDWNKVLRCAGEDNLSTCKTEMQDVVENWIAFLKKVAFRLRAKLGVDVVLKISKAASKEHAQHVKNLLAIAINDGQLTGAFRIPDAAGDLSVAILLKSRSVQYSIKIKAPTEGRQATRIKWLLKQLRGNGAAQEKSVPGDLLVKVNWGYGLFSQSYVNEAKENIEVLLRDNNKQLIPKDASPRSYSLQRTTKIQDVLKDAEEKRHKTFRILEGIQNGINEFYECVVEDIRPFVPKAPQMEPSVGEDESGGDSKRLKGELQAVVNIDAQIENADWPKRTPDRLEDILKEEATLPPEKVQGSGSVVSTPVTELRR